MMSGFSAFGMPPIVTQARASEREFSKKILEIEMPLPENPGRLIETSFPGSKLATPARDGSRRIGCRKLATGRIPHEKEVVAEPGLAAAKETR